MTFLFPVLPIPIKLRSFPNMLQISNINILQPLNFEIVLERFNLYLKRKNSDIKWQV